MSEEQEKPKKKWYKRQPNRFDRFALACLVIIVCAVAYIVVWGIKGDVTTCRECAYDSAKIELQNAVAGYSTYHNGSLPTLSGIYSNANCSNCSVINVSALLIANGGLLREVPHSCNLSTSGNDNCGGNASLGCSTDGSYIWLVDNDGNVFSYCAGSGCATNNSGYQGVWP